MSNDDLELGHAHAKANGKGHPPCHSHLDHASPHRQIVILLSPKEMMGRLGESHDDLVHLDSLE